MAEKFTAAQMIDAAEKSGGVKAAAARLLRCSRNTVERYIREHPTVADAFRVADDTNLDVAEGRLLTFMRGGTTERPVDDKVSIRALMFYLRTKGRSRGYGDRLTIDGDLKGYTDEQLEAIVAGKDPDRAAGAPKA